MPTGSQRRIFVIITLFKIDRLAFYHCSNLAVITIPYGISFGFQPFFGCQNLKECNFIMTTDLVTYISNDCRNLLPDINGLKDINIRYLFDGKEITDLEIPSDVTSIGQNVFLGCKSLASVTIPSSVKYIRRNAFNYCCSLRSITIPDGVFSIDRYAFTSCSSLKSVYVSWDYPISIEEYTFGFSNDTYLYSTIDATLYVPQGTLQDYRSYRRTWGRFKNIVEYDVTGVDNVRKANDVKETARYGANGQLLRTPANGLNIVKYSDGSIKKVIVK